MFTAHNLQKGTDLHSQRRDVYTPFTFGVLYGALGWTLFGIIWGLAAIGIALKIVEKQQHPIFSTTLYLVMGWVIVFAIKPLLENLPTTGLLWLVAGGLSYTLGVVFFATDSKLKYGHFIWHLFVLGGTAYFFCRVLVRGLVSGNCW